MGILVSALSELCIVLLMERDKLTFLKGALTGNAAQVLRDTD